MTYMDVGRLVLVGIRHDKCYVEIAFICFIDSDF